MHAVVVLTVALSYSAVVLTVALLYYKTTLCFLIKLVNWTVFMKLIVFGLNIIEFLLIWAIKEIPRSKELARQASLS